MDFLSASASFAAAAADDVASVSSRGHQDLEEAGRTALAKWLGTFFISFNCKLMQANGI